MFNFIDVLKYLKSSYKLSNKSRLIDIRIYYLIIIIFAEIYVLSMVDVLKNSIAQIFKMHQLGKIPMLKVLNLKPEYCYRSSLSDASFIASFSEVILIL